MCGKDYGLQCVAVPRIAPPVARPLGFGCASSHVYACSDIPTLTTAARSNLYMRVCALRSFTSSDRKPETWIWFGWRYSAGNAVHMYVLYTPWSPLFAMKFLLAAQVHDLAATLADPDLPEAFAANCVAVAAQLLLHPGAQINSLLTNPLCRLSGFGVSNKEVRDTLFIGLQDPVMFLKEPRLLQGLLEIRDNFLKGLLTITEGYLDCGRRTLNPYHLRDPTIWSRSCKTGLTSRSTSM